jgi:hypothetical protein
VAVNLELPQTRLGLFERLGGAVSLVFDPRQLLALVALVIGSLRRFVFPLISAVSDFGQWAHDTLSRQAPPQLATGDHSVRCNVPKSIERSSAGCTGKASAMGAMPRYEMRGHDDVQSDGSEAHGR